MKTIVKFVYHLVLNKNETEKLLNHKAANIDCVEFN